MEPLVGGASSSSSTTALGLVPHVGVKLEPPSDAATDWYLLHPRTQEKVALPKPAGTYELVWDEDDYASIRDSGTGLKVEATDTFRNKLLVDLVDGEHYIMIDAGGAAEPKLTALRAAEVRHKTGHLTYHTGATHAQQQIAFAYRATPCPGGFYFMWQAGKLYILLQLKTHKGEPSTWTWHSVNGWRKSVKDDGFAGQIARSTQCKQKGDEKDGYADCYLPWTGLSTFAMLKLLGVWGSCIPRHGGLHGGQMCMDAAAELLEGLVRDATAKTQWTLKITFDHGWQPSWPAREQESDVELDVRAGIVSLGGWSDIATLSPEGSDYRLWWKELIPQGPIEKSAIISLWTLLLRSSGRKGLASLRRQAVYQTAREFERVSIHDAHGKLTSQMPLRADFDRIIDVVTEPVALNRWLSKYVIDAASLSEKHTCSTLITDKGFMGICMDVGAIIYPDNTGVVCTPQV